MEEQKKNKEKKQKPAYGMWQNTAWMIATAWRAKEKKVPLICLALAFLAFSGSLLQLYLPPMILNAIEQHASIQSLLLLILVFSAGLILLNAVTAYLSSNALYGRITVRGEIIAQLNHKACTTSYSNLGEETYQKLMAKASNATCANSEATEAVWGTLTSLLQNVLGFAVCLALLTVLDFRLLFAILATTLISYCSNRYMNGYAYRHREEAAEQEKRMFYLQRHAEDTALAKDLRLFGIRPWLEELYDKAMLAYEAFHRRVMNRNTLARVIDLLLTLLRNGVVYALLLYQVVNGDMAASAFLLYFSAVDRFTSGIFGILDGLLTLHRQSLDLSTVREFLHYPEPFRFREGTPLDPADVRSCTLRMEDVTFRYPGAEKDTLSHIDLTLRPGEKLAIVGLNGAGKTTLIKLLCGFYDPTGGRVTLNGVDIRTYDRAQYYQLFAAVFQQFTVLPVTVAANVAQSETDAEIDRARVDACLAQAGLTDKIASLPLGIDTLLNREVFEDAAALSGGETQRLMLARALYRDAPLLVLDEPTAALDPIAEADLYRRYNDMTAGKSSVYISHRLASTRFCDRILFLEDGVIAEEGTHDELLAANGKYAGLFNVQRKYYQEEGTLDETHA